MIIDWLKFLPALALLLTPSSLFYDSSEIRYRRISRDWHEHWRRVLTHGVHAIDLCRAALGTWLLLDSLETVPNAHGLTKYAVLVTQGSIRTLAVGIQTVACRNPDAVNAPFAFVAGLLLAGISPLAAVFALALTIPVIMGLQSAAAFFPIVALTHLVMGFLFQGQGAVPRLGFAAFAAMVPLLWSLMFHRKLVTAYRAKRMPNGHQSDPLR